MDESPRNDMTGIHTDPNGRQFHYVHIDNGSNRLGIHFSAFFGDWGDDPKYRATFGGYFHRLKMLGSEPAYDWLFLCDAYGADENGTYYIGKDNDRFVDNAMESIFADVGVGTKYNPESIVTIGSSMGATAAIRYGIRHRIRGIIAISPHIDLDTSARMQGRERHVAWVLADGDTQAVHNRPTTRELRTLVANHVASGEKLPALFVQSFSDDIGVHHEQVIPFVTEWRKCGSVFLDERRFGGHTSEFATRELLLDAMSRLLLESPPPINRYKWSRSFRPYGLMRGLFLRSKMILGRLLRRTASSERSR